MRLQHLQKTRGALVNPSSLIQGYNPSRMPIGPIQLLRQATTEQRRTLLAASLGWMLDAFDTMLYALVLTHVMRDLGMSKATSGLLYTLTLLASRMGSESSKASPAPRDRCERFQQFAL